MFASVAAKRTVEPDPSGGTGLGAYDTTALTLTSTTADLNFEAGDVIVLTATKAASASNLVDLTTNLKFKDR